MKKQNMIVLVLAILLVVALAYIAVDQVSTWKQAKTTEIYQQGMQAGYEQTILQLANMAATCEQVPLVVGNQTLNIVAVDCLQVAQ